ncbi:centromere protein H [Pelobates fuscus]|uniref:centromere protein H n=1 Tax=Pelobates fuscus TaxID=191477 RepID=UPI002FE453F5
MDPTLAALQGQSRELGRVAVTAASEENSEDKVDLPTLLRIRDQVKHQHHELRSMVLACEASSDSYPEQRLGEIAKELQQEIEKMKVSHCNKSLVLQRMQLTDALLLKLNENNTESRLIRDTIKHITELSSSVIKAQKETRQLEEKLNEVKRKRLALKEMGCDLLTQIHSIEKNRYTDMEPISSTKILKICKLLETEQNTTTVIQNVFQHLILASRVNWADDPNLRDMVLKLEKNPNKL